MKPLIATLIVCLCAAACNGQAKDTNIPVKAVTLPPALALVDGVIATPQLLSKPWREMKAAFPGGCSQAPESPELNCPPIEGVVRISAMTGGLGLIDIVMTNPISCEEVYEVVQRRYGPGDLPNPSNKCSARWNLSKHIKTGYIRISKGKQDPSKLFLQFGVEQGP